MNDPSIPALSELPDPLLFHCLALAFSLAEVEVGTVITLRVLGLCGWVSVTIYQNKLFFPFTDFPVCLKLAQSCLKISSA